MNSLPHRTALPSQEVRDETWVPWPGGKGAIGYVRSSWASAFTAAQLRSVDDFLEATGEALSKPGLGSRYRARLRVTKDGQTHVIYLKRFGHERFWPRFWRWCEDQRWLAAAEREAGIASALAADGIVVAPALAWGVKKSAVVASFVALAEVGGWPAHQWAAHLGHGPEAWLAKCAFVRALGPSAAHFHGRGWRHRDFYLCHWFVDTTHQDLTLSLIDLQRVFRPRWRTTRWLVKDLAQLNYSATPETFNNAMRLRFAHAYFGTRRLTSAQKQLLQQVAQKTSAIARHDQRRKAKMESGKLS